MNLDIVVRPLEGGRYTVACPGFPESETEGASVEDALDAMADKIADVVAEIIRTSLKDTIKGLSSTITANGPINVPIMMTKLPISLN